MNDGREMGMARLKVDRKEVFDKSKRNLEPLINGDIVLVQNMTGAHPRRWSRTDVVIENMGYRQYYVKIDGSRRLLLCNRKNLRQIKPIQETEVVRVRTPVYDKVSQTPMVPTIMPQKKLTSEMPHNEQSKNVTSPTTAADDEGNKFVTPQRVGNVDTHWIRIIELTPRVESPNLHDMSPSSPFQREEENLETPGISGATPARFQSTPEQRSPVHPIGPVRPAAPVRAAPVRQATPVRPVAPPRGRTSAENQKKAASPDAVRGKRERRQPTRFDDYIGWESD